MKQSSNQSRWAVLAQTMAACAVLAACGGGSGSSGTDDVLQSAPADGQDVHIDAQGRSWWWNGSRWLQGTKPAPSPAPAPAPAPAPIPSAPGPAPSPLDIPAPGP